MVWWDDAYLGRCIVSNTDTSALPKALLMRLFRASNPLLLYSVLGRQFSQEPLVWCVNGETQKRDTGTKPVQVQSTDDADNHSAGPSRANRRPTHPRRTQIHGVASKTKSPTSRVANDFFHRQLERGPLRAADEADDAHSFWLDALASRR